MLLLCYSHVILHSRSGCLVHANILEPQRPAILTPKKTLAVSEAASHTARALRIVWTVEEGNVLVADVTEPVYLALVFEQAECDAVHRCIAPALVEEATRAVKVFKVVAVFLAAPEAQVGDLKVGPEVAGGVAMSLVGVFWSPLVILQPLACVIGVYVVGMISEELSRLWPQCGDALWAVIDIDVEAISLVVVLHPSEDVVVDVAEEVHLRLDTPVVLDVLQRGVLAEHAAVPPTHLMV